MWTLFVLVTMNTRGMSPGFNYLSRATRRWCVEQGYFGVYFPSNLHTNHLGYQRLFLTQTKLIPSSSRLSLTTKAKAPTKGALIHVSLVISLPTSFTHIYNTSNTTLTHTFHSSTIITKAPRYTTSNINQPPTTHAIFPICSL
jgi:hypothetical protein